MTERERREFERYQLKASATIKCLSSDTCTSVCKMQTQNISGRGAYLEPGKPLTVDTTLKVEVLVDVDQFGMETLDGQVLLSAEGRVLRSESTGMAIEFEKLCEVYSVR